MPGTEIEKDLAAVFSRAVRETEFSGAVRVAVGGRIVLEEARGLADRGAAVPNTPRTRFGIASGTKLMTALAVGTLIDQGKVTFDTPLVDAVRVPLPGISSAVTVRHLLTHTSGVYDYYDEETVEDFDTFELGVPPSRLLRPGDYLPLITGRPTKFEPGERFSYSNSGYVLLGLVIEELTRRPFQEAVERRVLEPAGMNRSGFFRFDQLPDEVALGYVETEGGWKTNRDLLPIIGGPDGGFFATAGDIERLWTAFLGEDLLSPELTRTFRTPAAERKPGLAYACGVWILGKGERTRYRIEGSDAGVSFESTCKGSGTVVTVMSNTSGGAWPVAKAIGACLDGRGVAGGP